MSGRPTRSPSPRSGAASKQPKKIKAAAAAAAAAAGASASGVAGSGTKSAKAIRRALKQKAKERKRKETSDGLPSREAATAAKKRMEEQHDMEEEQSKKAKTFHDAPALSEPEQVRQAKLISFYNTLHIDVLYEWAADFDGFDEAGLTKAEEDRDDITSWLVNNECQAPTSEEEAVANWRLRSDDVSAEDPAPRRGTEPSSGTASSSPPSSSTAAAAAASPSSARKQFVVPTRTSEADLDSTATSTECCHCGAERAVAGPGKVFPCGVCFHVSGKLTSSNINSKESVALRAQAANFKVQAATAASSAAAASSSTSSGGKEDNTTNKLSAADKELERLAADGAPFPRFLDLTPISAADALLEMRHTYNGPLYAHGSPSLGKLISAGKFMVPSWAVPLTAHEALAAKDRDQHGDMIKISKEGRLSTSVALPHRSLPDLLSFFDAFVSNIGPSVFDHPRALLDWFMLARSVVNVMKAGQPWEVANKYLMTTLSEKVPLRQPFGEFDMRIMQAVAPPFNAAPHNNYNSGAGGNNNNNSNNNNNYSDDSGFGPTRPSFFDLALPDRCRKWNLSACKEPCPGGRKHSCMWKACTDSSPHTGKGCKSNPDPRGRSGSSAPPSKQRGGQRA